MVMGKMTILGLLKKENKVSVKSNLQEQQHKSYWTLLEKDFMVKTTANEIIKAQKVISNAFKRMRFRKFAHKQTYFADIHYEADPDIAKEIFLVGEFTIPKWSVRIPMKYSFYHRSFLTQVKIQENSQFKFIVDGTFVWWPQYPFKYTKEKFVNNIFELNSIQRKQLSQSFKTKMRSMNLWISDKRERYFRKKNNQILYKIPTFECDEPKLLAGSNAHRMPYFSPNVKLNKRAIFKPHEILNNSLLYDSRMRVSRSFKFNESHMFSSSKRFSGTQDYDNSISRDFEDRAMIACRESRYISTHNNSKTPMQKLENPLPSYNFDEQNKSQKDDWSEYSEDDFQFLDEYFDNIPFAHRDSVELTHAQQR